MKLELIQPVTKEIHHMLYKQRKSFIPPLCLAQIAALTPPEIEITITDENISTVDMQKDVDLVGITVVTETANRAYEIADLIRTAFNGVQVSNLIFRTSYLQRVGNAGKYWQLNVLCPFQADDSN